MKKNTSKMPAVNGKISIAPSILSADLCRLGEEVSKVVQAGADWLHVDIMDGHFVPNLSFGPAVVRSLKGFTDLPLDVHLMVTHPHKFIEPFAQAGADLLTIHAESEDDTRQTLQSIKSFGIKTGVSIKPDTHPDVLQTLLDELDLILVMSVYPGFGGQSFLESAPTQIKAVRQLINASGKPIWLEVDGGINAQTAPLALAAGADALVAGHAIFSSADPELALKQIKQATPAI
ncbi:MAG: ribulose-phosphate 3-epimerase [Elusimicrobiaceae bacterium]|nr:ribulose-phosphate 3-epimerase [Elusimicrobiaceae bacterium]